MQDANVKVKVFGDVATFVVERESDGHTLSLSSYDRTLVQFDGNTVVQDHGYTIDAAKFFLVLSAFLS